MGTILTGVGQAVTIDGETSVTIIGERINPTGRKSLAVALQARDWGHVRSLAAQQVAAGAAVLDVNVGVPGLDEAALLPEAVRVVAEEVDVPLCLDSLDPAALAAGLAVAPGKPLVNSVNGEEASLNTVLPLVRDRGAAVIGLTMDERGIPPDVETRVAIAGRILERAAKAGIPAEDVVIDPLVLSVGSDSMAALVTLRTIEAVRKAFGVNVNLGASNVSFGLPDRHTINAAFLALAAGVGASCVITDPLKLSAVVRAADLLLGRDPYGRRYIASFRARGKQVG